MSLQGIGRQTCPPNVMRHQNAEELERRGKGGGGGDGTQLLSSASLLASEGSKTVLGALAGPMCSVHLEKCCWKMS